jgi:formate-dependent nitrite reductase cytochrome c552 subunit
MKKFMFLALTIVLALSAAAFAQGDILGPHNVNGHGCASCHAPHSGGIGNGGASGDTANNYIWGRDVVVKSYTQGEGTKAHTIDVTATIATGDPLFHTASCLSCHDGSATIAGMSGTSFETVDGAAVPTFIGNDAEGLANDHPVHVAYTPGGYNWPGTVTNGKITWDVSNAYVANFNTVYGHPASFRADATNNKAYVECGTCHNPHSMDRVKQTISGATTYQTSKFFVRGWYNVTSSSNSATQFCRSCHYSKSNENLQVNSTTF